MVSSERFAGGMRQTVTSGDSPEVQKMIIEQASETEDDFEVPASALVRVEQSRGYGSVPGLDDDELADPDRLERQAYLADWGPILALPMPRHWQGPRPTRDEFGNWDWGCYGTVDYLRDQPVFDKARYKLGKLREQLRNELIMVELVREHVRPAERGRVRDLALYSEIELEEVADCDERAYAKWLRRVRALAAQIQRLQAWRRARFPPSAALHR
jgi:hypothetical protein